MPPLDLSQTGIRTEYRQAEVGWVFHTDASGRGNPTERCTPRP